MLPGGFVQLGLGEAGAADWWMETPSYLLLDSVSCAPLEDVLLVVSAAKIGKMIEAACWPKGQQSSGWISVLAIWIRDGALLWLGSAGAGFVLEVLDLGRLLESDWWPKGYHCLLEFGEAGAALDCHDLPSAAPVGSARWEDETISSDLGRGWLWKSGCWPEMGLLSP
ncbi:hypothetical protein ACLOJK_028558, partial [Asimina triloba]